MTPFGIRKRLKKLILGALGADTETKADEPAGGVPAYKRDKPDDRAASSTPPSPSVGALKKTPPAKAGGSSPAAKPAAKEEVDESQGTTWVQVANLDQLIPGEPKAVDAAGKSVALYNVDGEIFATQGECGHAYGPLGDGVLNGHTITCPLHEWEWDVRDGSCVSGEDASIKTVAVKIKKNRVMVQL
jgi:nitrite reductase/ring-hydroxylating ferredoxin subunit